MNKAALFPLSNVFNTFTPKPNLDFGLIVFDFWHLKHLKTVFDAELCKFPQLGHCITLKLLIMLE